MTHSQQRLLAQLASSPNELASGLGQCLEALRLISTLPRASPVFVNYSSTPSPTIKAFGRDHLSRVPLRTVITLIKTSLSLTNPVRVATALFYCEDGSIDPNPVLVDENSWKELAPYVHTLHIEDDVERPMSALSDHSVVSGTAVGVANGVSSSGDVCANKGSSLSSNAPTFVPSSISIKTSDGSKVKLQDLFKPNFSPTSPQTTAPFAIEDTGVQIGKNAPEYLI